MAPTNVLQKDPCASKSQLEKKARWRSIARHTMMVGFAVYLPITAGIMQLSCRGSKDREEQVSVYGEAAPEFMDRNSKKLEAGKFELLLSENFYVAKGRVWFLFSDIDQGLFLKLSGANQRGGPAHPIKLGELEAFSLNGEELVGIQRHVKAKHGVFFSKKSFEQVKTFLEKKGLPAKDCALIELLAPERSYMGQYRCQLVFVLPDGMVIGLPAAVFAPTPHNFVAEPQKKVGEIETGLVRFFEETGGIARRYLDAIDGIVK